MLVYVSAFHPVRTDVDLRSYFAEFQKIAETGVPILLFLDPALELPLPPNVRRIPMTFQPIAASVLPPHRNPAKDTVAYMSINLRKLQCMVEALRYTDASHLAWIDFRLFHVVRETKRVQETLVSLTRCAFPGLAKIANPGCWPPCPDFDIWSSICWRYCGGFFLGPRDAMEPAYRRQCELVEQNLPRLTWEVNYWSRMDEYFQWYPADHNDSIIANLPCRNTASSP